MMGISRAVFSHRKWSSSKSSSAASPWRRRHLGSRCKFSSSCGFLCCIFSSVSSATSLRSLLASLCLLLLVTMAGVIADPGLYVSHDKEDLNDSFKMSLNSSIHFSPSSSLLTSTYTESRRSQQLYLFDNDIDLKDVIVDDADENRTNAGRTWLTADDSKSSNSDYILNDMSSQSADYSSRKRPLAVNSRPMSMSRPKRHKHRHNHQASQFPAADGGGDIVFPLSSSSSFSHLSSGAVQHLSPKNTAKNRTTCATVSVGHLMVFQPQARLCQTLRADTIDVTCSDVTRRGSGAEVLRNMRFEFCDAYGVFEAEAESMWSHLASSRRLCVTALRRLTDLDRMARTAFGQFSRLMAKFDCDDVEWSVSSCDACLAAYKQWLCSTHVPYHDSISSDGGKVMPCRTYCRRVEALCPFLRPQAEHQQYTGEPSFFCSSNDFDLHLSEETVPSLPCHTLCHPSDCTGVTLQQSLLCRHCTSNTASLTVTSSQITSSSSSSSLTVMSSTTMVLWTTTFLCVLFVFVHR